MPAGSYVVRADGVEVWRGRAASGERAIEAAKQEERIPLGAKEVTARGIKIEERVLPKK